MGRKIEKKSQMIGARIPESMKQMLEKIAKDNDRSISWVITKILQNHLKNKGPKLD
jgi:hypothetical protein